MHIHSDNTYIPYIFLNYCPPIVETYKPHGIGVIGVSYEQNTVMN